MRSSNTAYRPNTRNCMDQQPTLTSVTVQEALEGILARFSALEPVSVPLPEALGLVLAEDVHTDSDLPPFDNSAMDGYAVQASDTEKATPEHPASLRVT